MSTDAPVGTRIGDYEIQQLIGRGSMSVVYVAEHIRLKHTVALKLLKPEPARDDTFRRPSAIEWELLAQLDHPNIIPIFEVNEVGGVPYIAMKHVRGESLADAIEREGAIDPERALDVLGQVAAALEFAHGRGVFHGAVKPNNILIASDADPAGADRAYLCDFAMIKDVAAPWGLTSPAQTVGTRGYVAPEQFRGDPVDARTDVYALGCVLFETLTGSPPFASEVADPLTFAHFEKPPPSAHERRPDLPIAIDAVLEKALAKRRESRFDTPTELFTSARESLVGRPLQLPGAGASAIPDDLAAVSSPNGRSTPTLTLPASARSDTTPTMPAPIDGTVPSLTFPPAPVDDRFAWGGASPDPAPPSGARAGRRRLLLAAALVAVLALVGGVAIALSGGEDEDVRAGAPTTTGPGDTGPTEPVETGSTGTPGVVEPPIEPIAAPTNVEVTFVSEGLVLIEWEVGDAGSPPVRFLVLRDGERVARVETQRFRDTDVAPGERHAYRVVAVGEDGSKARSSLVVAVPIPPAPSEEPATDSGGGAPPPPPPDQCDGIIIGDDCIQD
jgi:serine/threonine protein kinase